MENKILEILKKIRLEIKEYSIKNKIKFISYNKSLDINLNFPILELENIEIGKCDIHGGTIVDVKHWEIYKPGIKIADLETMKISKMYICLKYKNNLLPLPAIIHTFLHELAHTITLPEKILSKNITQTRKKIQPTVKNMKKKSYMCNHHSNNFYINFAKILRIAETLEIYTLPKTHRNFKIQNLQRFDSLINPNDLISLGYTSIKI